jgi:hypothetical protein
MKTILHLAIVVTFATAAPVLLAQSGNDLYQFWGRFTTWREVQHAKRVCGAAGVFVVRVVGIRSGGAGRGVGSTVQEAVHRAAVGLAAPAAQNQDKRIPPGYLWTGIGLLAGAGLYFLGAALYDPCEDLSGCESSFSGRTWAQGFVLAGAGAAVLIIGNSKRQVTPALLPAPRGIAVGGRLSF